MHAYRRGGLSIVRIRFVLRAAKLPFRLVNETKDDLLSNGNVIEAYWTTKTKGKNVRCARPLFKAHNCTLALQTLAYS